MGVDVGERIEVGDMTVWLHRDDKHEGDEPYVVSHGRLVERFATYAGARAAAEYLAIVWSPCAVDQCGVTHLIVREGWPYTRCNRQGLRLLHTTKRGARLCRDCF